MTIWDFLNQKKVLYQQGIWARDHYLPCLHDQLLLQILTRSFLKKCKSRWGKIAIQAEQNYNDLQTFTVFHQVWKIF